MVTVALGLLTLPLVASPADAATATFRQVAANEIQSGKVNSLAFNQANTAGNLIVVYLAWTNTSSVKVADANGNNYRSVDPVAKTWGPNSTRSSQVFYAWNIAGGANTVRATFATAISSQGWADLYIHEYSGIGKEDPLDVSAVNTGTAAEMQSGLAPSKNATDLIFGAGASSSTVNQAGSGFTSRSTAFGNRTEDKNVTTVGSQEATAKQDGNNDMWVMHMVAFKVDPSAPDTTPPSRPADLSQVSKSTEQIDLSWKPSTDDVGVTGYEVFRNGTQIATPTTSSYSDTGLAPLTTYKYTIRARDLAGNVSRQSATVSATTLDPPPDRTVPIVSITAPANGATVSGMINLEAAASDDRSVVGVQFLLDGKALGAEVRTPPYSLSWNSSTATKGPHVLTARARDAANNSATSGQAKITVDTTAPTVAITSPTNDAQVSDIVNVFAEASDEFGVADVQFIVDGVDREVADTTAPYALAWDSRTVLNGVHTLTVRARDTAGNLSLSDPVTVKVANDTSHCGQAAGSAPIARILEPTPATGVVAGEMVSYKGEGTVPGCGPLPGSAFNWTFERVNDGQPVPVNSISGSMNGEFPIPVDSSDFLGQKGNTRYRISLTVTSPQGLRATSFVEVTPKEVKLTFKTVPAGLTLYVDGMATTPTTTTPTTTPEFVFETLAGSRHTIEARNQTSGGLSYRFASWSDEQPQQHEIVGPTSDQTLTATYRVDPSETVPITFKQQSFFAAEGSQNTISTTFTNAQTAGDTNVVVVGWRSDKGEILSVTDDKGNPYEPAAPLTRGEGKLSQAIYFAKNIGAAAAGKNTVKVAFRGDTLGPDVRIAEYSGLDPTNPVVKSNSGSSNSAAAGPVTTTTPNAMLFMAGISWSNYGSATNEFTTRVLTQPQMGGLASTGTGIAADRIVNAIGTFEAAAPVSPGGPWLMQAVAFRGVS